MRTTIDIPDGMLRQVKAKCALEGRTMRGMAILFFSDWLSNGSVTSALVEAEAKGEERNRLTGRNALSAKRASGERKSIRDLPMIGMWKDREDMKDPVAWVRNLRKPRLTI